MYKITGEERTMITDRQIKLVIGSLLHDIGKVVYRSGDGRNHSQSGYEYLKTEAKIFDQNILNCVRFHHGKNLRTAQVADDDLSYLTYYADNIAAFTDRREAEEGEGGFDKTVPLDSVFNILNGNHEKKHYAMQVLDPHAGINYPTDQPVSMDEHFYKTVIQNITECLRGIELDEKYLNSLLSVLEANLSYIPSSTSKKELTDISLYDHIKMTAAIAACTEQYLEEKQERNYKKLLFENAKQSYEEKMFLLYSMDISGIQNFIYTVGESGVLKGLRARSFYLEIMMEHVVDELLEKLALSRAGGRACVTVEKVGINLADARIPDNAGEQPADEPLQADGPTAYFATIPVNAMVQNVREHGLPCHVSFTAGTYVCNCVMYNVLHLCATKYPNIRAGFIHVPFACEQVVGKASTMASMPLETIAKSLEYCIEAVVTNKEEVKEAMGTTH